MPASALQYRDFTIEMANLRADGRFTVRALGATPGGEARADEAETATFHPDDFKDALARLERRKLPPAELIGLGARLTDLLFPGRVRGLYERSLAALADGQGLRLRLRIEPVSLAALPWEFTHMARVPGEKVAADFLALRRRVSVTRYEVIGAPPPPLKAKEKIRIVVALANPIGTDELDIERDELAILAAVHDLRAKAGAVEPVVVKNATRERLLEVIAGADVFHFAGHGVFEGTEFAEDGTPRKRGKIVLETAANQEDRYDSEQLAVALGDAGVRLAVLGACSSAARDAGGAWTGVAPALARQNLAAVVAMQYKMRDTNAATFMAHLYARALAGYAVDEAVFEGRLAIFNQARGEERDWGVPVLYLRAADGLAFPPPPAQAAGDEAPSVEVQRQLGAVRGESIGAEVGEVLAGQLHVSEVIDVVEQGGKATGLKLGTLGGGSRRGEAP
jgi:hypothetical protein